MAGRALSARSVIASTLLGTHPPHMSGRLLIAFAERFGVTEGTARVALSRMVDRGELTNHDGEYHLAGHLLDRQRRQDESRAAAPTDWDGQWVQAVVVATAPAARRAERRRALAGAKLAELREGVWMRPDNLGDRGNLGDDPDTVRLRVQPVEPATDLAQRLWDLDGWAASARSLMSQMTEAVPALDADDASLAPKFELAAAVLRHLLADPELPSELWPPEWPAADLRRVYDEFDAAYARMLRRFFRAHR